jgi:hypothetical protein
VFLPLYNSGILMKAEILAAIAAVAIALISMFVMDGTKPRCPLNSTAELTRSGWFCIVPLMPSPFTEGNSHARTDSTGNQSASRASI